MRIDFVGDSYQYPSSNFDAQVSINCYPDKSATGNSKAPSILCPTPGRELFAALPLQSIRGWINAVDRAFAVAYDTLYEVFSDGTYTSRGTISTFSGNVSMATNGLELMIVDGTEEGWILTLADNSYAQITDMNFIGGVTVCFIGGYFLVNNPDSGRYQISDLYDGTTWPAAYFANAEGSPDNLVAVVTVHQQTALVGSNTIQFVANTGASPFPLDNIQGVFIEYGSLSPFAVEQAANTIFWIGNDKSGANVVWMADGYSPRRISTTAIESYLSQYDTTEATSYSYQENGHYFIEWSVPSAPFSIVYDVTMEKWHNRARWNSSSGMYERDRANFHIFAFGKHLVTDYENGNIYEQSTSFNMDDDVLMRRTRRFPYFSDDLEFLYFSQLQIDMQTGVGLVADANTANTDPQIFLRWSDDGGHTWSAELACSIGRIGQYNARAIWRRLGRSRARIFECSVIANVPVYLIAAHAEVSKGYA